MFGRRLRLLDGGREKSMKKNKVAATIMRVFTWRPDGQVLANGFSICSKFGFNVESI
jgi:hypothetical protein